MSQLIKSILIINLLSAIFTTSFALNPSKLYVTRPDSLSKNTVELKVKTADGYAIKTWVFYPNNSKSNNTTIIMSNGDAGNMSYSAYFANELSKIGYTVMMYDYRGFGESDSFIINRNQLYYNEFSSDLDCIVRFSTSLLPKNKLVLYAYSMGTIITTISMEKYSHLISSVIYDGLVFNPAELITAYYKLDNSIITMPKDSANISELILKTRIPLLIFDGIEDKVVKLSTQEIRQLKNANKKNKIILYKEKHGYGWDVLTKNTYADLYILAMNKFINKNKK